MKDAANKSWTVLEPAPVFTVNLSEFNALLGADAGVERMLDLFHLSDQIGGRNKFGRGAAARNDDMQSRLRSADPLNFFQHFRKRQQVITQHVNKFIEDEQVIVSTAQLLNAQLPGFARRSAILFRVLSVP